MKRTKEEIKKDIIAYLKENGTGTMKDIGITVNISPRYIAAIIKEMLNEKSINERFTND